MLADQAELKSFMSDGRNGDRTEVTLANTPLFQGAGCEACSHTGYRGRAGIYELLMVDDSVRRAILDHASADAIRTKAIDLGMRTLREDGWRTVREGTTTLSEIIRVTRD
jgi:type II secretory ATPase GspE/PulE/Tfp pilus assembly ATPase PilB-like protein